MSDPFKVSWRTRVNPETYRVHLEALEGQWVTANGFNAADFDWLLAVAFASRAHLKAFDKFWDVQAGRMDVVEGETYNQMYLRVSQAYEAAQNHLRGLLAKDTSA